MALSERQMLLLDNLIYGDFIPGSDGLKLGTLLEQFTDSSGNISESMIKEAVENGSLHLSGDFHSLISTEKKNAECIKKYTYVLREIAKDSKLMDLTIAKTTPEYHGSIRAACFVDSEGDATVAFRGTGGSFQQWYYNSEGYGDESQQAQRDAKEFIDSLNYDKIDVTGHSNGGNQAMYVTLLCGDKIGKCVSFEGQGFSKEFVDAHSDEIKNNKTKIKNICGENDPVSQLLITITGSGELISVPSTSSPPGHGSYGILEAADENEGFNDKGNFRNDYRAEPPFWLPWINEVTVLLSYLSNIPIIGSDLELFTDIMGIIFGLGFDHESFLSSNFDERAKVIVDLFKRLGKTIAEHMIEKIKESNPLVYEAYKKLEVVYKEFKKWIDKWIEKRLKAKALKYASSNPEIVLDTDLLRAYSDRLTSLYSKVRNLDDELSTFYLKVSPSEYAKLIQADLLMDKGKYLVSCAKYLKAAADLFDSAEKEILRKMN